MKKVTLLFAFVAIVTMAKAQTLDEVKTLMYYEKLQTAKTGLDKLYAATPNDANVVYQLSQWHLIKGNAKEATNLLTKAMAGTNNALLLKAGLAHAANVAGDNKLAQTLATEVMATAKTTDWPLMLAVGKACGDLRGKQDELAGILGFMGFGILDKLTKTFTPKKNDPAMFIPLGDCLVRQNQGGRAVNEYEKALGFNPKYAEAYYRAGILFDAVKNYSLRNVYFDKALAVDANYAPVYKFKFFEANKASDYAVAKENYAKYASLTETSPEIESYTCDLIFLSKDYNGCIACVDKLIASQGAAAPARLYAVKAYAYDLLGDSISAATNMDAYFANEKEANVDMANVVKKAAILAKIPSRQNEAFAAFDKAVDMDTTAVGKMNTLKTAAALAAKMKNMPTALKYYEKVNTMLGDNVTNIDIFNAASIYYTQKNYTKADELYTLYTQKFPKDIYGFVQRAYIARSVDSAQKGTAKPQMDALLNMALLDTANNKSNLAIVYNYYAAVSIKAAKYAEAATWYEKILELNPNDEGVKKNIEMLKNAAKPVKTLPPPPTKSATPKPKPAATGAIKPGTTVAKPTVKPR